MLRLFNVDEKRVHIIYNGIDPDEYRVADSARTTVLTAHGIDPAQPFVLFVGRIARQKGIIHLVNAIKYLEPGIPGGAVRGSARHARRSPAEMQAADRGSAKREHVPA